MCQSIISRHQIKNSFHSKMFCLHDILLPLYFSLIVLQVWLRNTTYHQIIGKVLVLLISPLLFTSGMMLSFYMNSDRIIFQSYGLSFMAFNLEVGKMFMKMYYVRQLHIICFCLQIYTLVYLLSRIFYQEIYLYYFSVLWCLPILHYVAYKHKHLPHFKSIISFIYLSLLGSIFSYTNDSYWIRTKSLHMYQKLLLNQLAHYLILAVI